MEWDKKGRDLSLPPSEEEIRAKRWWLFWQRD